LFVDLANKGILPSQLFAINNELRLGRSLTTRLKILKRECIATLENVLLG